MAITAFIAHKVRHWHRAATTRRQLSALSDAQLADIGLERFEIAHVAEHLAEDHTVDPATRPSRSLQGSVQRGMNLSPLFQAYLPRVGG